jgi:hypothetical protein
VVSKAVVRCANRSLDLASSRSRQSSITPQRGDWGELPAPILVRDVAAHMAGPVREALARTTGVLEEFLQGGIAAVGAPLLARVDASVAELDSVGLAGLARRMAALGEGARALPRRVPDIVSAWLDAALRAALVAEVA